MTGSKYLITFKGKKLLVDCGLFQGVKSLRLKNWDDLPVKASEIDAVILTHAHIDHSGYIPRLINKGFRGKVYCTHATKDLCKILLPDAGYLQEEEAEYLNKNKKTKHKPALPLFTYKDAVNSLEYFVGADFEEVQKIDNTLSFKFKYAGHILGAASVIVNVSGRTIGFSGDLGRQNDRILYAPEKMENVNYLVTESTYGNRKHRETDVLDDLAEAVNQTYKKNGVMVIPAFAVGRAQSLMYYLWLLRQQNRIPHMPMYLNSPMATNVNDLLLKYKDLHKLSSAECFEICNLVKYVRTSEESIKINERHGPMLIISASGMLGGGRVLHHVKAFGPDPKNTILLTGFQAAGTRGEALESGAKEVKIHGEYVPILADVKILDNVSAHADYQEIITWLSLSKIHPQRVFITHGESSAADDLRRRLNETFGWECYVPEYAEKVVLE
ncbi:MAG: MBL fold metallo-hydrolase [Bdellovibrionota bacterium]